MNDNCKLVMVAFPINESGEIENLHAMELANGNMVLDNIPFYIYGISCGDEFGITRKSGRYLFDKIIRRGGHSTYRVRLCAGMTYENFLERWSPFEREGCGYEGTNMGSRPMYAIDVPPAARIEMLYELLEEGERDNVWEFEEGHYYTCG